MKQVMVGLALVGALVTGAAVQAHHSFAAEYDSGKPVTLTGTVKKVAWGNPHIFVFLDVKEGDHAVEWSFEGGAPNSLFRLGWRRDSLKVGDVVTVEGFRAKDGSTNANARSVTLADGRRVFAASSGPQ